MARPIYESAQDRDNEANVANAIEEAWGGKMHKLPRHYGADYGRYVPQSHGYAYLTELIEVKDRSKRFAFEDFRRQGGYKISLGKIATIAGFTRMLEIPMVLAVKCTDGLWVSTFRPDRIHGLPVEHGGRRDRNDWQDQEPLICLPCRDFERLT